MTNSRRVKQTNTGKMNRFWQYETFLQLLFPRDKLKESPAIHFLNQMGNNLKYHKSDKRFVGFVLVY